MKHCIKYIIVSFFMIGLAGCIEDTLVTKYEEKAPILNSFSPATGEIGTEITIVGENLQRVDTVMIGSGMAQIKYRVNSTKIVATVSNTTRSGKIRISSTKGFSESTENFTISYLTPSITTYPTEGTVNEEIIIEGENLHFVEAVLLGEDTANIIAQRKNELVFKVPFSENETPVALRFVYFNGSETVKTGPDGNTFVILKEAPIVISTPSSLTKYSPIVIQGERLKLINSIFVGNVKALIKLQSDEEITLDMPTNYFGGNMTGNLTGIYYGTRQLVIYEGFQVYADPNEPRYYTHTDILLSARTNYGGSETSFFDCETGMIISSCDAADNHSAIDFYLYDQAGYVQLYGPHNGGSTVKNFKCDGKTIDAQDGKWNDFYGENGITTKFKVLNPDSATHKLIIDAYEAKTLVELNDELFTGIAMPGSSSPRVYKEYTSSGFTVNSHFSIDKYKYGWVRNYTTGKNGIIKMTEMPKEAVNGRIPELKFDIIWAK